VHHELEAFLAGSDEWPSYSEFQRRGRKNLRDMVNRYGGARRWAKKLGVRFVERRPGYAPRWTEDRIRADLEGFLRGRTSWPSRKEFEEAGRKSLRDAVRRTGGPERWAEEFGLPREDQRAGSRRVWTEKGVERELRKLLARRQEWPTRAEFEHAGLASLHTSIYRYGGPEVWARRFRVRYRPRARRTRKWTEERMRAELTAFCADRKDWPTAREFEEAGLGRLYRAASLRGGVARWSDELGLRRGRRRG
jgi:hypothetical protein